MRDYAALRLLHRQVEVELIGLRRIVHHEFAAARLVQPVDLELGVNAGLAAFQPGAGFDLKACRHTANRRCA